MLPLAAARRLIARVEVEVPLRMPVAVAMTIKVVVMAIMVAPPPADAIGRGHGVPKPVSIEHMHDNTAMAEATTEHTRDRGDANRAGHRPQGRGRGHFGNNTTAIDDTSRNAIDDEQGKKR